MTNHQYKHIMQLIQHSKINAGDQSHNGGFDKTAFLASKLCLITNLYDQLIIYSGASAHMCHNLTLFSKYKSLYNIEHMISILNGRQEMHR